MKLRSFVFGVTKRFREFADRSAVSNLHRIFSITWNFFKWKNYHRLTLIKAVIVEYFVVGYLLRSGETFSKPSNLAQASQALTPSSHEERFLFDQNDLVKISFF
eukprot:UN28249